MRHDAPDSEDNAMSATCERCCKINDIAALCTITPWRTLAQCAICARARRKLRIGAADGYRSACCAGGGGGEEARGPLGDIAPQCMLHRLAYVGQRQLVDNDDLFRDRGPFCNPAGHRGDELARGGSRAGSQLHISDGQLAGVGVGLETTP